MIRESELKMDRHNRQIQKSELKTNKQDQLIKESELKTNRHNWPIQKSELDINRLYRPIQSEDRIGIGRSITGPFAHIWLWGVGAILPTPHPPPHHFFATFISRYTAHSIRKQFFLHIKIFYTIIFSYKL